MAKAAVYVWAVNIVGIAVVVACAAQLIWSPLDVRWLVLAMLALVSGATVLRLPFASFSVGDAFSFAALFLYGVEAATLTVALDTLAISLRLKASVARTVFNIAAPCLAMWCAGGTVFWVAGVPLPAHATDFGTVVLGTTASVAMVFGLGSGLVAGAIAAHEGRRFVAVWRQHFVQLWANPVACGYVGALIAIGLYRFGMTALLAIVPIPLILYLAFRAALGRVSDHVQHLSQLTRMHQSTVEAFATAVDAKDQVTHGHIRRVQAYCRALAGDLKANDEGTLKALEAAALLHDVGKIGIPEYILNKPGRLTHAEFEVMKQHVAIGADILSTVEFPFPVVPIVRNHHENWDGSGYPDGVRGTDIPLGARILSVVDCFDALTSDRPYRAAMTVDAAFDILRARRGSMYDPEIVDRFIELQPGLRISIEAPDHAPAVEQSRVAVKPSAMPAMSLLPERLVQMLTTVLPGNLCIAYSVDTESSSVVASAAVGPHAEMAAGHRVPLGHGISGWVASSHSQIIETDAGLDFPEGALARAVSGYLCSSVSLPLTPAIVITVYGPQEQTDVRARTITDLSSLLADVAGSLREAS